jgi:hypothetical protein
MSFDAGDSRLTCGIDTVRHIQHSPSLVSVDVPSVEKLVQHQQRRQRHD